MRSADEVVLFLRSCRANASRSHDYRPGQSVVDWVFLGGDLVNQHDDPYQAVSGGSVG